MQPSLVHRIIIIIEKTSNIFSFAQSVSFNLDLNVPHICLYKYEKGYTMGQFAHVSVLAILCGSPMKNPTYYYYCRAALYQ